MRGDDVFYRAMLARDYRFDGKFYVGVKTTGVYCRPICPARPRRENVEFFPSAHLAERRGYRPCLRCRPEAAPQSPAWLGKSALVQRALKALSDPQARALDETSFAARFGVGARHLRRLFTDEVGKSPKRIALDARLDFARKLIAETRVPMADIAFTAGFASVRRFNDAIRERFRRPPTRLRRLADGLRSPAEEGLSLSLPYRPPFDWESALAYYRKHAVPGLERCEGNAYERVFRIDGCLGIVEVTPHEKPCALKLRVVAGETRILSRLAQAVRRMFDLDSDPLLVANAFADSPRLAALLRRNPGLRAPRGWDPFETAVCAILGQLVSIAQANRLVAQLTAAHGEEATHPVTGGPLRLFPESAALAEASLDGLRTTQARKETLREFARRVAAGSVSLESAQDPAAFRAALREIRGIGPWTAEYLSLRVIADADAFPSTDLVLKRALAAGLKTEIERVRPWRGYAAACLWRHHTPRKEKS